MSNLTATLSDPNDNFHVIAEPGGGSAGLGTALSALSSGINSLKSTFDDSARAKRQAAADARQAAKDQQDLNDRGAKDLATLAVNDANLAFNAKPTTAFSNNNVPFSSEIEGLQADAGAMGNINASASKIASFTTAVTQGSMSPIARRAMIDSSFNRIITEHPEYSPAVIAAQFQALGVESDLFRSYKQDLNAADSQAKAALEERNKYVALGQSITPIDVAQELGMTDDDYYNAGRNKSATDAKIAAQKMQLDTQIAQNSDNRSQFEFDKTQNADLIVQSGIAQVTSSLAPTLQAWMRYSTGGPEAGSNAQYEVQIAGLTPKLRAYTATIINNAVAAAGVANPSAAAALRSQLESYVNSNFFQPMESRRSEFAAAAKSVQTNLGMRIDTAAPLLNEMKALGIDLQNVPGLLDAIPQDLKASLSREINTIASGKLQPDVAKVHMANVIGVLRGEKNLGDIDGAKARQILTSTAYTFTTSQAKAVAEGRGDADGWLNMSRQVVLASEGVNRGSGADTLTKAISGIARADNINAINKLMGQADTREEATILSHASRAGAAHLVSQARYAMVAESKQATGYNLVWDRANAQFVVREDPNWKPSARTGGGTGSMRGEYVGMTSRPAVPASLQALVRSTNEGISYLARTTSWDPDAPKGTVREVRAFYARDEATSDMKAKAASGSKNNGSSDILTLGSQLERDLSKTPDLVVAPSGGASRGERNNNPGNLEDSPFTRAQPGYKGSDGRFAQYETKAHGEAAQAKLLANNYIGKGYNTVQKVIGRYAPRSDNAASFDNYVAYVSRRLNINPSDTLTPAMTARLAEAMREFETGNTRNG